MQCAKSSTGSEMAVQAKRWPLLLVLLVKFCLISISIILKKSVQKILLLTAFIYWLLKWGWMSEKENIELDRKEDPMDYSTGLPSDWRFGGGNLPNSCLSLVAMGDTVNVSRGVLNGTSSCTSASMLDSFAPNFWDPSTTNSQNLGFTGINVQNNGSSSNAIGISKDGFGFGRVDHHHDHGTLEMGWNSPNSMLKGGGFLPNGPVMLPQSLCQFATDSGFIERAARFSCFSEGNFGDMVNAYGIPQSIGLYDVNGGAMHGTRDALAGHVLLSSLPGGQSQETNLAVAEVPNDASPSAEHLATKASPLKNDKRSENLVRPTTNESERAESIDDDDCGSEHDDDDDSPMLEGTSWEPCIRGLNSKKRTRIGKDADHKGNGAPELPSEGAKDNTESQQKGDRHPISTSKTSGKNAKQGSQASDPPKEEYIHVRARRGQATNSHSLAERVRREKISERMKFLQDLVPGCSKVTGKAVMLDEIINYVQSLQRQVEFLSMKLATVNRRLDFNIEGLLPKDILHQRPGHSSEPGFPLEMSMAFSPLHPSQTGLIQSTLPSMANSSNILRRTVHPTLAAPLREGFKEPNQLPDVWEDELHNVVCMNFATTAPLKIQDVDGTVATNQMKVEL